MLCPMDRTSARHLLVSAGGFSFIDLMLALVILTIGVLAFAQLQVVASLGNTSSQNLNAAITVAEAQLEHIKGQAYGSVASSGPTPVAGTIFTQQVTVTANSPVANSSTVQVMVTWSDQTGTHTIPMATVITP